MSFVKIYPPNARDRLLDTEPETDAGFEYTRDELMPAANEDLSKVSSSGKSIKKGGGGKAGRKRTAVAKRTLPRLENDDEPELMVDQLTVEGLSPGAWYVIDCGLITPREIIEAEIELSKSTNNPMFQNVELGQYIRPRKTLHTKRKCIFRVTKAQHHAVQLLWGENNLSKRAMFETRIRERFPVQYARGNSEVSESVA